jgi:RNA polymerase sigma-70 factor, ECF subfamily
MHASSPITSESSTAHPRGEQRSSAVAALRRSSSAGFRRGTGLQSTDPLENRRIHAAIVAAKEGDREAVQYLYCCYADTVYSYVCTIVRDRHEAEDVTQDVFSKLIGVIDMYERREVPFSAWILRIARNVALDHLRKRRPVPAEDTDAGAEGPHDADKAEAVQDALALLPEDQRRILLMRHLVGLSPDEIASRLGKSTPAVHGLHHRARSSMKRELTAQEAGPATSRP